MKKNFLFMTFMAALSLSATMSAQTPPSSPAPKMQGIPANAPQGQMPPQGMPPQGAPGTPGQMPPQGAPGTPGQMPQQGQRRPDYKPVGSDNVKVDPEVAAQILARTIRPEAGSTRKGNNPVLFMIGDSTMRTGTAGNGDNGQIGWGYYAVDLFDTDRITVENHAMGGTSSRTFYDRLWADVVKGVQPGDWMIIQIGHNDSGPYNTGMSRNSIPGTGKDSLEVVNDRTGEKSMVYSYGEYIRRYVNETRARGGNPILLSLTPRNKWNEDGTLIRYNVDSYTPWLKEVAKELNVPFLDFNNTGSDKYEFVYDKKKVDYMFFSDNIHTSDFGAHDNLQTFEKLLRESDIALKDYMKPAVTYTSSVRNGENPVMFLVGDGTMCGADGSFGWGEALKERINGKMVSVDDRAVAGMGTRTYLDAGLWEQVYQSIRPGDYVLIQFGYDESGDINTGEARGVLDGNGDEKQVMLMEKTGRYQGIYTYGFYIRKYCLDVLEKGATPIVVSYIPTLDDKSGFVRNADNYGLWGKEAATAAGVRFLDLNTIAADVFDLLPAKQSAQLYTGKASLSEKGAKRMAHLAAAAIKSLDCGLDGAIK